MCSIEAAMVKKQEEDNQAKSCKPISNLSTRAKEEALEDSIIS